MRSLKGWKALVCLAAAAGLVMATAPESFAVGKPDSVIDSAAGEVALNEPGGDAGVVPTGAIYYPRANYVWPYATGPYYGKVSGREQKGPGVVITAVGSFHLDRGFLPFPNELKSQNKLDREAAQYFLVQVHPESLSADRWETLYSKIRDNGGEVIRHMPVAVVLARLTPQAYSAVSNTRDLMAIEPYHAAFKLDPAIGRTPLLDPQKSMSDVYTLDISLHRGEDSKAIASRIASMGGDVKNIWSDRIQAEVPSTRLQELAGLEAVYMVHEAAPIVPWDQKITNDIQTGGVNFNVNPYHDAGIRGEGQVLTVLDNGIQLDAGDLSDTSTSAGTAGPGHRKVRFYGTTGPFGGSGDASGCDAPEQGGYTHGHLVSAIALGNPVHPDITFRTLDVNGNPWDLTGVAPDAKLVAYDANVTPAVGACQDTLLGVLDVGELYDPGVGLGSLDDAYSAYGSRLFNFSWGSNNNSYTANADDVDEFLNDNKDAMVFIAVGNLGQDANNDTFPDLGSIGEPATAKNALAIGSSGGPDDYGNPANGDERSFFSGVGPAGATGRFAPVLMAPGQERGTTGKPIAFSCRTNTNDSLSAVICDSVSSKAGTSFAAPAAAGAGALVRDYFAQGFHPDGTSGNTNNAADEVANVSGALVKSVLIASAEYLGLSFSGATPVGIDNVSIRARANNEQGYGRIQLDNVLPLTTWADSPTGLIVVDGGIPGGVNDFASGLTGVIDATAKSTQTSTFELCDDSQELRLALSWIEAPGDGLVNDLDLELFAPDGTLYYGNFFTDDDNGDGVVNPLTENCPTNFDDGTPNDNGLDRSEWSLAVCSRPGDGTPGTEGLPTQDATNPTAGIFLSPNPEGDVDENGVPILRGGKCDDVNEDACGYDAQCAGVGCLGGKSQVQAGTYTISVTTKGAGSNAAQRYALAIAGGVCSGSSAAFDSTSYVCNDDATIAINERSETSDPAGGLSAAVVAARTTVEVVDADDNVVDSESGSDLGFEQQDPNSLRFVAEQLPISAGTGRDPGNGVLDVRDGDTLRVIYADESVGGVGGDPNKVRVATATVGCQVQILAGASRFAQFGLNTSYLVVGGCERNARGFFEFGFPDRYMDAQESIAYRFTFTSIENDPLENAVAELSCVFADADSPASCKPGSADCDDPNRENNAECTDLTIVDPVRVIGLITAGSAISANYTIAMNPVISGTPDVEMLLRITGEASGKSASTLIVNQHTLNVDEATVRYNTDFPNGGTLFWDRNNNGLLENPVTTGVTGFPTSNNTDYVLETVVYSDLTLGTDASGAPVTVNDGINAPWNFDNNDGGFTSGLAAGTDDSLIAETIAQWGEDKNFNNKLDGRCASVASKACDRFPFDPINCSFCNSASTNPGAPCTTNGDCPGGACDQTCINLEERDPENFPVALLDQNWSTRGGCGWQTKAPGTCTGATTVGCYNNADCGPGGGTCNTAAPQASGGIWHTGRIGSTALADCAVAGDSPGQCQIYETIGGVSGQLTWFELLVTPELTKVNQEEDAAGNPVATAEIGEFRFNWAVDMPDNNVSTTWEFDNDTTSLEPVDLKSDFTVLITSTGDYGALNGGGNPFLTRGWGLFAPIDAQTGNTKNGTVGNNRVGKNSCYFEGGAIPVANLEFVFTGLPLDDDVREGYCPTAAGQGGTDAHLNYCTWVCATNTLVSCEADSTCSGGVCVGGSSGFCSNAPLSGCQAECTGGSDAGDPCDADADCQTCQGGFNDGGLCTLDAECIDGVDDGFCGTPGTCPANANDDCDFGTCVDIACAGGAESCVFTEATIDQFVLPNGPVRGVELNDYNGPDMRFTTLEDLFGATGNKFAGAIGFQNREANAIPEAVTGYGVGVDDVVVEWREFTLEEDATDCEAVCVGGASNGAACTTDGDCGVGVCGGGSCATINLTTNNIYEGNALVGITVVEFSPSGNDCDGDGSVDVPADFDCDDNGIDDVIARVDSPQEVAGERVTLNQVAPATYKGAVPISSSYDVPGTLFVATQGNTNPTIRATYIDLDDGTGRPCQNSVDPNAWTQVQVTSTIFITPAQLVVTRSTLQDNGDDDGWADTGETIELAVEVSNKSGFDVTGVTLRLTSNDPNVGCITKPTIAFGDLASNDIRFSEESFRFIISPDADRTDVFEELTATLNVSIDANEFQSLLIPQEIVIDLDLDATGGGTPTTFFESFEGGFGQFTTMHFDETLNPPDSDLANREAGVINADGNRCQYADPDWEGSASYGNSQGLQCFPNPNGAPDAYYFHIITDRAFSGVQSLGFNIFLDPARGYTGPNSQIDAIRTIDPINLGYGRVCSVSRTIVCADDLGCPAGETCGRVAPKLSMKHQISLLDHRTVNAQPNRTADRAIMSVQVADSDGIPAGPWIKAQPFVNVYDSQANSNYFNCSFDPNDDGNDEGDFFDPTDPVRSQGPSSTCSPGFMFAHQGDTDAPFNSTALGDASDGPGFPGVTGIGTWVEPQIDMARFLGRRVRVRFLETGLKLGGTVTWEQAFNFNPDPGDDGWFLDDVQIVDAINDPPADVTIDDDVLVLPACDDASVQCGATTGVVAAVTADPDETGAPGQVVELDASGSTVDNCISGVLQYKFWVETDGDLGTVDNLVRDWTDNDTISVVPQFTTNYGVGVRCATDTACSDAAAVTALVNCPSSGNLDGGLDAITLDADDPTGGDRSVTLGWSAASPTDPAFRVEVVRGQIATLRANQDVGGEECALDDGNYTPGQLSLSQAAADAPTPNAGDGWYFLGRSLPCNYGGYGGAGESVNREVISACN